MVKAKANLLVGAAFIALFLASCASSEPEAPQFELPEIQTPSTTSKILSLPALSETQLPENKQVTVKALPLPPNQPLPSSALTDENVKRSLEADQRTKVVKEWLGKAVCMDTNARYEVRDQSGQLTNHVAQVQIQALIIDTGQSGNRLKVKVSSIFSEDAYFVRWLPYLEKPAMSNQVQLKTGYEIWQTVTDWYFCGGRAI